MKKFPIKHIFHAHTYRCGHSCIKEEELVELAIKNGIKVLNFTDHVPIPGVDMPRVRMNISSLNEYIDSINHLKEKYKDKIKIGLGFEVEYLPDFHDYLYDFKKLGVDNYILGQHFVKVGDLNVWCVGNNTSREREIIDTYRDTVIEAMNSGLFKYFAHPDIFLQGIGGMNDYAKEVSREIIQHAIDKNIYLEFNVHGIINFKLAEKGYPNLKFWELVKDEFPNAKITLGLDVHDYSEINSTEYIDKALEIVKSLGLKISYNYKLK